MPTPKMPTAARLILRVADPEASAAWYEMAFGWPVLMAAAEDGWMELDAGGGFVVALHNGRKTLAPQWPKLQVQVDDLDARRSAMLKAGIPMGRVQRWRHLAWSEGSDPDGNVFQIVVANDQKDPRTGEGS